MAQRIVVHTPDAPQPMGAYSQAIRARASELLFVAGQTALDAEGNLVGTGDAAAQTRQVFDNIGHVLAAAGASFANILEFTTYLVGRQHIHPYLAARSELFPSLFPNADYPANTLLVVDGLGREDALVEIKAIAALP